MKTYNEYISDFSFKSGDLIKLNHKNKIVTFQINSIDTFNKQVLGILIDESNSGTTNRIVLDFSYVIKNKK